MNRNLIFIGFLFLVLLVSIDSSAQDRIVTSAGDTISCKIETIEGRYIIFTQNENREEKKKIAFDLVKSYEKDVQPGTMFFMEPAEAYQFANPPIKTKNFGKGFMLGFGLGYSYRLAKASPNMPQELKDYIQKLKSGITVKVDAAYFFGRYFGIGAKYYLTHSQNRLENVLFELNGGGYQVGEVSDNINIHSIQFVVTSRVINKTGKFHFLPALSAGYTAYQNNAVVLYPVKLTSGTFSMGVHLSTDFALTDNLFAMLGVDYTTGILSYYNAEYGTNRDRITLDGDTQDNLTRVEFWGGVRYYFKSVARPKRQYYD